MTISLERALKYRRQYFMLNALAHVLPTAPQSPAPPPTECYDKLGKFILLCAIRLLAQFPLEPCTELLLFALFAQFTVSVFSCDFFDFDLGEEMDIDTFCVHLQDTFSCRRGQTKYLPSQGDKTKTRQPHAQHWTEKIST